MLFPVTPPYSLQLLSYPFLKISRAGAPGLTRLQGLQGPQHPRMGGSGLSDPAGGHSPAGAAPISPASTVVALALGFLLLSAALSPVRDGALHMTLCWQINEVMVVTFGLG